MSTYDVSSFLTGSSANFGTLITNVNKIPASWGQGTAGLLSVASSTYATLSSVSKAVEADDLILLVGKFSYSASDGASSPAKVRFYQDSTGIGNEYTIAATGNSTGGGTDSLCFAHVLENQTGTITWAIKFARSSGSGTIYSVLSVIDVILLKKR